MNDIQHCPRKHHNIETSGVKGGESTTHTVTTSFDTAFEVDKQVVAALNAAFVKLSTCASIGEQESKKILKKISQSPELDESYQDTCELASGCVSKSHNDDTESNKSLVDMMLQRLRCLREEELASLATIVATCGLNAALAGAENDSGVVNNGGRSVSFKVSLPGLDKFPVKRLTRLEKEIHDAKNAKSNETLSRDNTSTKPSEVTVLDLGSMLTKHTSKLEKEIGEIKKKCGNEYEPAHKGKPSESQDMANNNHNNNNIPSLGEVLVKRVSRREHKQRENEQRKGDK